MHIEHPKNQLDIFKQLCTLLGSWKEDDSDKNVHVDFRMTAHGSVLVEKWNWPEKNIEALTLYHMDGDVLMATHYCPMGNQPKLLLDIEETSKIVFKIKSITNLPNTEVGHNVEFWMRLIDSNSFIRSETYEEGNVLETIESSYIRQ